MRYVMGRVGDSSLQEEVFVAVGVCSDGDHGLHCGPSFAEEMAVEVGPCFKKVMLTRYDASIWPRQCQEGQRAECR